MLIAVLITLYVVTALVGVVNSCKLPVAIEDVKVANELPVYIVPYSVIYVLVPSWIMVISVTWYDVDDVIDTRYLTDLNVLAETESNTWLAVVAEVVKVADDIEPFVVV